MSRIYNPGTKFHLSFAGRVGLIRYFDIARLPLDRQTSSPVIMETLGIDETAAAEFIEKTNRIRVKYCNLKPQIYFRTKSGCLKPTPHDNPYLNSGKTLPAVVDDTDIAMHDPFLSNFHFMSDLGVILKRSATMLIGMIDEGATLDHLAASDLSRKNFAREIRSSPVCALEIKRILTALGLQPRITLPCGVDIAEQMVKTGLRLTGHSMPEIDLILDRNVAPEIIKQAHKDLNFAGVSRTAARMVLDAARL